MKRFIAVPLACTLLAVSGVAASAHHHHHPHKVHHGTTNPRDPNFNPLEFPLCFAWDARLQRDVWICGRSAY